MSADRLAKGTRSRQSSRGRVKVQAGLQVLKQIVVAVVVVDQVVGVVEVGLDEVT